MAAAFLPRIPGPSSLRGRIVSAATSLTCEAGWSSVTMGRLAEMVGISRQTVYNEVVGKRQLAEEIILTELQRFLSVVDNAFDECSGNLVGAVRRLP